MYFASALKAFMPALAGLMPRTLLLAPLLVLLLLLLGMLSRSVCATKNGRYCRTWNLAVRLQHQTDSAVYGASRHKYTLAVL
jgi:hypothetical protein